MKRSKKTLPQERVQELKRVAETIDREESAQIKAKGRTVKARHAARRAAPPASSDRSESGGTSSFPPQRGDGL